MIFLVKRKIPAVECISVTFVFGIYYIGFSLLSLNSESPSEVTQYTGIFIFTIGSFLNTYSEIQRHFFKKKPENKGKLYSDGLFRYSIHINYFGDILWVTGYAIVTQNFYSYLIPFSLLCFFVFYNIPELDDYLKKNYGSQFDEYSINTKKLIPYIY
ncbi:MAG: DUF1295 domain-containing protein [Bacteroidetes bacterium]|nr:DUF1295 domain-containing protein [Bacteroidota bacterium]